MLYIILLCLMCFLPQVPEKEWDARCFSLFPLILWSILDKLRPSFNWSKCKSVVLFLLSPLIFSFCCFEREYKHAYVAFAISLFIECTQILLDIFIDANRVFEIDDLWTNTLGGYLAFLLYKTCVSHWKDKFLTSK